MSPFLVISGAMWSGFSDCLIEREITPRIMKRSHPMAAGSISRLAEGLASINCFSRGPVALMRKNALVA